MKSVVFLGLKSAAFLVGIFLATILYGPAGSASDSCEPLVSQRRWGAGFLEQCGDQLRSFALVPTDGRWRDGYYDFHGTFSFKCLNEPTAEQLGLLAQFPDYVASQRTPCPDEPEISGSFIDHHEWIAAAKDGEGILRAALRRSFMRDSSFSVPPAVCQPFDLSVGGLFGKATCVENSSSSTIIAGFSDNRVAFTLIFSQQNRPLEALKDQVKEILAHHFKVERGTGDANLLRWIK